VCKTKNIFLIEQPLKKKNYTKSESLEMGKNIKCVVG